jgi:hypothetical protein
MPTYRTLDFRILCQHFGCMLAGLLLLNAGGAAADPLRAIPAHQVVNKIGVQTHIAWPATNYRQRYPEVKALLGELAVRSIRDALGNGEANRLYRDLWRTHGIRMLAVADARTGVEATRLPAPELLPQVIAGAKLRIGTEPILAFEGLNEPNQLEAHYGHMNWPAMLSRYMLRLNAIVLGDRDLRHLPIIAPGLASPANPYWYARAGDYSKLSDLGNGHVYGTYRSLSQKMDEVLPIIDRMNPGKPRWVTEFGWQTRETAADCGWMKRPR